MDNELFELAKKVGAVLTDNKSKIATGESCTGGWVAQSLTEIPGSSLWFDRGFVTYSNNAKIQMLDVSPQALEMYGAVSAEVAKQMAEGVLANSEADWAVAITGIAGPDGGSTEKPVGTVFTAWKNKNNFLKIVRLNLSGNRHQIRRQSVAKALEEILHYYKSL